MKLVSDLSTLYHLTLKPRRGETHAERLESFYSGQENYYDEFRHRLLQGRCELIEALPWNKLKKGVWLDLGCGTGANLDFAGSRVNDLDSAYLVDLSPSLLKIAKTRAERAGHINVYTLLKDVTHYEPEKPVDLITFSYSLSMIPDWSMAIDQALRFLRPGGYFAAVDFYVSRKHPSIGFQKHRWLTRTFWPIWFAFDGVTLSPDPLCYMDRKFTRSKLVESLARIPYFPVGKVPYFLFIGQKPY